MPLPFEVTTGLHEQDALARVVGEFHGCVLLVVVLVFVEGRCALIVPVDAH